MDTSNEELLTSIRYYQRSLEKYSSLGNTYKLICIIEKLKMLPIATLHLQETGIGRTVNALRKLGGEVSDAAKGLVVMWKEMVIQEEVQGKETIPEEMANEACVNENDNDCYEEKENSCVEEELEDIHYLEKESSSSHILSDTERRSGDKHETGKNKSASDNGSGSSYQKKDKYKDRESSSNKRRKSNSSNEEHNSKKHHDSSGFESEGESYEEKSKSKSKRNKESDSSENEEEERERKHKSKKSKHSKDSSDSEDSYKKQKSSKSSRDDGSKKSKSREKTESKKREYDSSSDREANKSKSKQRSHSKSKRESDCEEEKSSSKHKSKKSYESSSDNDHKSKHDSKSRHSKDSSKSRESKSHSSHSEKHDRKDKKESKRDESKEKHSHKKDESRTQEEKHRKSKDEKETSKKHKSSSSSKQEVNSKTTSSSSKHKSSSEKKKDKVKPPKPVNTEKIMNGIDSGSGASFAEALGMCGPLASKSSSSTSKKKSSSLSSYDKPRSSSSYVRPEKTEMVEEEEDDDNVPSLLKEQPQEPININISSLLPDITPNYRPVGFPIDSLPKRVLSQDEALSQVISNKNLRTKVYSGNKSYGKVETLFDLCVRILQDNIDALEYTGGVPYLILKPVLERATPDQLFNMEHHNPYLIEDTDGLWLLHCQKEFRNKKREELESWREMYMRCLNEREARLNAITANIKQSQDKSTPIRTTKLAYIDSVVKPPRNIARKQAKNGITFDKKPAQTPASRVAALASLADGGKVAVSNPGSRAVDRSSSSTPAASAIKPKKAPLMAKTLSFLKNRFRR